MAPLYSVLRKILRPTLSSERKCHNWIAYYAMGKEGAVAAPESNANHLISQTPLFYIGIARSQRGWFFQCHTAMPRELLVNMFLHFTLRQNGKLHMSYCLITTSNQRIPQGFFVSCFLVWSLKSKVTEPRAPANPWFVRTDALGTIISRKQYHICDI